MLNRCLFSLQGASALHVLGPAGVQFLQLLPEQVFKRKRKQQTQKAAVTRPPLLSWSMLPKWGILKENKKFKEISILDLYHVVVLSLLQLRFQEGQENSIGLSAPGCTAQKEPSKLLLKTNFRVLWYSWSTLFRNVNFHLFTNFMTKNWRKN